MSVSRVYGIHAVRHVLNRAPERVLAIHLSAERTDPAMQALLEIAEVAGATLHACARSELDRLAGGGRHQGIVADIRPAPTLDENSLASLLETTASPAFLLALDGVQDPHNLGAVLRTADAVGLNAVITPRNRAASLTPAARKVAAGAAETVPVARVTNLARTLRSLQQRGITVVGADQGTGVVWHETDLTGPLCVVMGGEGKGLRRLTRECCDVVAELPMCGSVESLNVSVAAGACLYEAVRQRRQAAKSQS